MLGNKGIILGKNTACIITSMKANAIYNEF